MENGWKPNVEISPSCPRCGSSNTKFCYYNNYSLTQPRYFCKGCRRYWTKGGSLRNVPVGGGCRKNRRGNSSKSFGLSTNDGILHSRSFDDLIISKNSYDHGHCEKTSQDDSSSASHIDLALVYANFLNPQPEPNKASGFEIPELPSDQFDPSPGLTTNISSINSDADVLLPQKEQDLVRCLSEADLCDNDHFMPYPELGSTHKHQDRAPQNSPIVAPTDHDHLMNSNNNWLPPLPGEDHDLEAVSQGILWPDYSFNVMDDDHGFQMPQQPVLGSETQDPDHLIFGSWSPVQFSRYDDALISTLQQVDGKR